MLSAAISFNARLTINGQDVRNNEDRLDVETLIDLVVACYCMAYVLRYGAGKTVENYTTQERNKRVGSKLGFLSLIGFVAQQLVPTMWLKRKWNSFIEYLSDKKENTDMTFNVSESVRVVTVEEHVSILAKYGHHTGEAVLDVDGAVVDLLDVREVLELKYEKGKLTGVPKTSDVSSVQASPGQKTSESRTSTVQRSEKPDNRDRRVVPSTVSQSAVSTSTLLLPEDGSKKALKKMTNEAVRAMSNLSATEPLRPASLAALRDLRNRVDSTCGSLHVVRMVGDGRCAFYAMLHCIGLPPTVEAVESLKRILWLTCPEERRKDNLNLTLDDFTDMSAWGTTDNFGLFSALVGSDLCVHVVNGDKELVTRAYSRVEGASHSMHVRWNVQGAGHVDMCEGPTFQDDVSQRVSNFIRNVQTALFQLKGDSSVLYEETSRLPSHPYVNRSGLKLLSILATHPELRTEGRVLDLCGAPGGFLSVLRRLNADVYSVSGPAIEYSETTRGAEIMRLDILAEGALENFPIESCDLVVADGGSDESYKDPALLHAQVHIIRRVLKKSGKCVLKIGNFFEHLGDVRGFFDAFARVVLVKPDFSAGGNTEVYAVCTGYGLKHLEVVGVEVVRQRMVYGLMKYVDYALNKQDASNPKKTGYLIQVLEANVFGSSGEKVWRPSGLTGGGGSDVCDAFDRCKLVLSEETDTNTPVETLEVSAVSAARILSRDVESLCSGELMRLHTICADDPSIVSATSVETLELCPANAVLVLSNRNVPSTSGEALRLQTLCDEQQVVELDTSKPVIDLNYSDESEKEESLEEERVLPPLYSEEVEAAVEKYIDAAVLCEVDGSEGKLTWKEKLARAFGKQPRLCKNARSSSKTKYSIKSKGTIKGEGKLRNGKHLLRTFATVEEHQTMTSQITTTSFGLRDVATGGGECVCGPVRLRDRRVKPVIYDTKGTCVNFLTQLESSESDSGLASGNDSDVSVEIPVVNCDERVASEICEDRSTSDSGTGNVKVETTAKRSEPAARESCNGLRLAEVLHAIDPVNVPENEPLRATATYFAVDKIKQDVLISYAWKTTGAYKISKCLKELLGFSTMDNDAIQAMSVLCVLDSGVRVVETKVDTIKIFLIVMNDIADLEGSVLDLLNRIASCLHGKLRLSLDVFVCKDYNVDSLAVMQFSNAHPSIILVLYLHNQFTKGRAFGSPYLYPEGHKAEMFPKLTDEDLGLVRRPTLLDDSILENRYRNSMIEFLHTSTFAQNVLAVRLKGEYNRAMGGCGPNLEALVSLAKKGLYFYDNHAKTVMSGDVRPYGWAFILDGSGWRFARYDPDTSMYEGSERYFMFTRETKTMLSEEIAANLRKIDLNTVRIPKITWVNGPPGCGKTEFALRNHQRPSGEPDKKQGDMILTVTKESIVSLRKRLEETVDEKYLNRNYRTVASVLMNGTGGRQFEKVIVDEALMIHAGAVAFAVHIVGAKELILIGDIHQIPYIDRDHVTQILYSSPSRFCAVSRTLIRTHRCPVDVTYLLSAKYEGFYSVSPKITSMRRETLSGRGVIKEREVVYLVLFQSDKEELVRKGYDARGSKVLTVHEAQGQTFKHVRYVRTSHKPLKLYESEGHAIVAISRHTDSFVYYTDVDDMVVTWMRKLEGMSESALKRWNDERRVVNGEVLSAGWYSPEVTEFKPSINKYAGPEAVRAMSVIVGVQHNPNTPHVLVPAVTAYGLPRLHLRCPKDTDLGYLQTWYNNIIPTAVDNDVLNDQLICESSDLEIATHDRLVVDPLKVGYKDKKYARLNPVLKTLMPRNVVQSQVQTLLCLSKRNANAPVLRNEELDPKVAATYLYKNFVKSCLRDDFDMDTAFDTSVDWS